MTTVQTCDKQTDWDEEILSRGGHPLQLWGWGEVKAAHNWQVDRIFIYEKDQIIGAAQLLIRKLPKPFNALVYVPRGPVTENGDRAEVLDAIAEYAKDTYRAVAVTIEPDWRTIPHAHGWHQSSNTILIPRTLILDLNKSEDELLGAMTKKTRQYIRKSANEAVEVRRVRSREELAACLAIYKQTAQRAGFGLHDDQYYYDIFDKMGDYSLVTATFLNGQPVAFLWLAISERTAFELYGGMDDEGQRLRANYILKWSTIQMAKKWGIERYDFNGLLNDGVSTFKQSFADHEDMLVGTYDRPLSPLYVVWNKGLPLAKKLLQKIKNR
jgi:lipid II:glycine glycyltransferase (peptidoglycan interpeptide bridge formation enzyme)